jgi:RNA polymerase sigma factor for flagellar operon FliA
MPAPKTLAAEPLTLEQKRLVEDNMSLVRAIAAGWRSRCRTTVEYDDLVQVGCMGLMEAAMRFDASRGTKFAALAAERVRGSICDYLRSLDPLTRDRRSAVRQLSSAADELRSRLGREPRPSELSQALGWAPSAVESARGDAAALAAGWAQVRDASVHEEMHAVGEGEADADAFATLLGREVGDELRAGLDSLPDRERAVVTMYYVEERTLREIGAALGVTESRACQLHSSAMRRLRATLADRDLAPAVA